MAARYGLDNDRYDEFNYLCYLDLNNPYVENYARFHKGQEKPVFVDRLKHHYDFWVELRSPEWLLDLIKDGVKIPFESSPPKIFLPNSSSVMSPEYIQWVRTTLQEFLDFGFVSIVSEPPYCVMPLQIKNTSGKLALIYDMSPLNQYVDKSSFKLEGWEEMFEYSKRAEFAVQFDLKKFYLQIGIEPSMKKYFGFTFPFFENMDPIYFVWNTVPYGYTRAPFIARNLLKPLIAKWRFLGAMVVVFYDDGMAVDTDKIRLQKLAVQMHCDLLRAGLIPGIEKCKWLPERVVVWNGLVFDFDRKVLSIKHERIEKAESVLEQLKSNWPNVTVRSIAKIVGMLISMRPVFLGLAQLRTRMLQNLVNIKHYKNISWECTIQADCKYLLDKAYAELEFWCKYLLPGNCRKFLEPTPDWIVWTDAAEFAVGGFVAHLITSQSNTMIWTADNWLLSPNNSLPCVRGSARMRLSELQWNYRKDPPVVRDVHDLNPEFLRKALLCHRNLEPVEIAADSNERELIAALFTLRNCAHLMQGSAVTLYMDSCNAVALVDKGSSKIRLQTYAESISDVVLENKISLTPIWIARDLNNMADAISCAVDYDDYSVTVDFYRTVQKDAGVTTTVDAFANGKNAKEPRFYSITFCKGSIGVDAFRYMWSPTECYWIFPPVNLVGRVIQHLEICKTKGVLVVPQWKNAYFYPLLRNCKLAGKVKLTLAYEGKNALIQGSDPTSYFGPSYRGNLEVWLIDYTV